MSDRQGIEQSKRTSAEQDVPLRPREADSLLPLLPIQLSAWKWFIEAGKFLSIRFCTISLRILGPLDAAVLQRVISEVVGRHEALRVRFVTDENGPRQCIDPPPRDHCLPVVDLRDLPSCRREEELQRLVQEFSEEKIDLTVGPLFAARLFKLSDEEHVLIVAVDHIVMDRASMGIVNRDIWALYHQVVEGLPASLPPLPIQYGDYAVWQHQALASWQREHEAYWRERLDGASSLKLQLGDGLAMSSGASRCDIYFGQRLTEKLHGIARREGALLSTVVLAIYVAWMSRWYCKEDLLVWFVSSGRYRPELRNMVGFVAHGLYLRVQMYGEDCFLDLLERVNSEFCLANKHRDFGWVPHLMEVPTTDLQFNWGRGWAAGHVQGAIEGNGIRIQPFVFRKTLPGWASGLFFEAADGVLMQAFYDPTLIAAHVIERFGSRMVSLACEVAERPRARIAEILDRRAGAGL